jgi:hypothetical protein
MKHISGAETCVAEIRKASKICLLKPIIMPVSGVTVFRYAIGTIYSDSFCCLKLRKKSIDYGTFVSDVKENELCYRSEQVLLGECNSCEGLGINVIQPFFFVTDDRAKHVILLASNKVF